MKALRACVVGAGRLGGFHAQKYDRLPDAELVAVVDTREDRAREVAERYGARALTRHQELPDDVDVASVAVPTLQHFEVVRDLLQAGIHVLVEKPITATQDQGRRLVEIAEAAGLRLQVGHIERFNPVTRALVEALDRPMFIEAHRISPFQPRGTDVDVVLDLMVHDIDLALSLVDAPVRQIQASGGAVLTSKVDVANARLQFDNGSVANLTASRVGRKSERIMRVFQADAYLAADFERRTLSISRKRGDPASGSEAEAAALATESIDISPDDALESEIGAFLASVREGKPPLVDGAAGLRALETAQEVLRQLQSNPLPGQGQDPRSAGMEVKS